MIHEQKSTSFNLSTTTLFIRIGTVFKCQHSFHPLLSYSNTVGFLCLVVEDTVGNTSTGVVKQEEGTGNILSPLFSGTKPKKRLTSKLWDNFIPTFMDGKVAQAKCMHCHQVFNCHTTCGITDLWNHQAKCSPGTHKRPMLHKPTSLPSTQQNREVVGSDPKQKKLPLLLSSHKKGSGTEDVMPELDPAFPDNHINTNRMNREVNQNGHHEALATDEQNNLTLPVISTDKNKKNQGVDHNISPEELIRILAMHGHATRMVEQEDFGKLVAHLNPVVKVPSHYDMMSKTFCLFRQEQSKLKEKLTALSCRVCLSAYIWHYDPLLVFLCLTVHYIDDEWEKQNKIIKFCPVDPSFRTEELSYTILGAIKDLGLDDKVFSIILDDAFVDDSVVSNVKASLQKRNKAATNKSLLVARYATYLLDEVIQVGLDELDGVMERLTRCSRYQIDSMPSLVHYPNVRYAPSMEAWTKAHKICYILEEFHKYKDSVHKFPSPAGLFDNVWNVKEKVDHNTETDRFKPVWKVLQREKEEEEVSTMLWKMEKKFKECWKACFLHFCMPMVMNPNYRLEHIKSRIQPFTIESAYTVDSDIDDYIGKVHDTLLDLYGEYSNQVQEPRCPSWSKISTEEFIGRDILHELYLHTKYPYGQRPLTELDHYLQEARVATGEFSVLQWWKEHSLTYPTIGQMARDILALPCNPDSKALKAAIRTARLVMSESGNTSRVDNLVCIQDWLTPAGSGLEDGKLQGTLGRAVANLLDARLVKAGVVMSLLCVRERALRYSLTPFMLFWSFKLIPLSLSMEDVDENGNNGINEQGDSTNSVPSTLLSGTKLNKRFRSKVWDDFIPAFVDGKVAWAECMMCHRVLNCSSKIHGTSSLLKHQVNCTSWTQKRAGCDPKQKKLTFLPSSQNKCSGTADAIPEQEELVLPNTCTETKRKNREVDQNGSCKKLAAPEQHVASPLSDNRKSHRETLSPDQKPVHTIQKNEVDHNLYAEELIGILAIHGQSPMMMEQSKFRKLVTGLDPIAKMPSPDVLRWSSWRLFDQEKSKLKEKLIALCSRISLSAYMWHYDLVLAFLCLTVHYVDDEWEKQQKIIRFCPLDPSCNSNELSNIISRAIEERGLDGKVFSILLDDAFVDDSVASNVKARLQKWNKFAANRSLFVVRYATHLLDQVMQVGLDKLGKFMEKSVKFSKHMEPTSSVVQYPNRRYAPSGKYWITADKICRTLGRFHIDMDSMHTYTDPTDLYDKLWDVKNRIRDEPDFYSGCSSAYKDEGFSVVLQEMQQKFKERWELCFFHFCMPMVMDPKYRLRHIKSRMRLFDFESYRNLDREVDHYIHYVHNTLVSLFYEYSNHVDGPNFTSGSKTSKETAVAGDTLTRYYHLTEYPYGMRHLTEQYLQEPCLTAGEPSVLQWWKENNQTYPTVARMARDILALPCCTDNKVATRTARISMSEFGNEHCIEEVVCSQDWLKPAGMACSVSSALCPQPPSHGLTDSPRSLTVPLPISRLGSARRRLAEGGRAVTGGGVLELRRGEEPRRASGARAATHTGRRHGGTPARHQGRRPGSLRLTAANRPAGRPAAAARTREQALRLRPASPLACTTTAGTRKQARRQELPPGRTSPWTKAARSQMEDMDENANKGINEHGENTDSNPSPLYSGIKSTTRLRSQVIQVGLDELDTYMEKSAKFSNPTNVFDKLWVVKKEVHKADVYRGPYFLFREGEAISKVREKMKRKFMECWNICFMHFFMPMVMDPNYRLKHIMSHLDFNTYDDDIGDYLQQMHDTLASLFNEYSNLKEDDSSTSGANTSKETVVDGDMLMEIHG
ncbi:hypothetical protein HU200_042264 [Digitaria exilis]|uniref:BED-type domain-containing protein n=1 Tax=Digitaria exilis TaxID=1010633 RepID=A0A835EH78_9POAL|nr:hypothetical protein HU200_042264 [Digitaria exilis]